MADENCGNCKFRFVLPHTYNPTLAAQTPVTVCRRYPPLASLIMQNIGAPVTITYWPGPSDQDWCGEWRSKEGAAIRALFPTLDEGA